MKSIVFALPGNDELANHLVKTLGLEKGFATIRSFPDEETYIRIESTVKGKNAIIVCSLDRPDKKALPVYFLSEILKDAGAEKVTLLAPYLAYMRQDKQFNPGECVTSEHYANFLSSFLDSIITIDPHLHRIKSLGAIYSMPTVTLHAARHLSTWIKENIVSPILIGPDGESKQWVSEVAANAGAPYTVLNKIRVSDEQVKVSVPHIEKYRKTHTPVIVDDIISSGKTMIETIHHLKKKGVKPPVCLAVHAIFAADAYKEILAAGAERIITCNTITHPTNAINLYDIITEAVKEREVFELAI